mgnify:CR=1 FL=1
MKDIKTAANPEEVRLVVTTNLDRAAKLNFAQVQQESHLEGIYSITLQNRTSGNRLANFYFLSKY